MLHMHKEEREDEEERKWSGKVEHGGARLHGFTQEEVNLQVTSTLPVKLIHSLDTETHHFTQR